MRLILAPNAFKGTFDSVTVAMAWRDALLDEAGIEAIPFPLSDGGDGFVPVVVFHRPGVVEASFRLRDPIGRPVEARWAWDVEGRTAYLESAAAIGLHRLETAERDPETVSSSGLGRMIRNVSRLGLERIVLGLGGTATVDGGWGMARELGFRFEASDGGDVERPGELARLARIEAPDDPPLPEGVSVIALADVDNRLIGSSGAATVYGPQKGADPQSVERLDAGLERLAERWVVDLGAPKEISDLPGAGAAGGLGAGCVAFLGAGLTRGFDWFARMSGFGRSLRGADGVVTGEGRFDEQSEWGKGVGGVLEAAQDAEIPVGVVTARAEAGPDRDLVIVDGRDLRKEIDDGLSIDDLVELARMAVRRMGIEQRPAIRNGESQGG